MEDFAFKLDRSVWLALINQSKIFEAYECFNSYMEFLYKNKRKPGVREELEVAPKFFYTNLFEKSKAYINNEDYDNALLALNILFKIDNLHIESIKNYIKALAKTNQKDLSKSMIEYLKKISNNDIEHYKYIAEMYKIMSNNVKSIEYMQKYMDYIGEDDLTAEDYTLIGCYCSDSYHETLDEKYLHLAEKYFIMADKLYPQNRLHLKNICIIESLMCNVEKAKDYYKKLLQLKFLTVDDFFDYSVLCMKMGDFDEYYKYTESRKTFTYASHYPQLKGKQWDFSSDIKKSTLLIYFEQGYGDTILHAGFLDKMSDLAEKIIFVVQDELYLLYKDFGRNVEVIPQSAFNENVKYDYYIFSMDILKALRLTTDTAIVNTNIITRNTEKISEFKKKYFNNNKLKIGLSVVGNKKSLIKHRDIDLKYLDMLANINNAEFYILSKDFPMGDIPEILKDRCTNLANKFNTFDDTASAIENCDLVIATDNCILNLAGALNKKTYGLFNWSYSYRWYNLDKNGVCWYKSMTPYVNSKMNDWKPSIEKMITDINSEFS